MSSKIYELHAEDATKKLMKFLFNVLPTKRIGVMYFDEAHELGSHFWTFLRLVQHQLSSTKMWYTFMGTKSKISCDVPHPGDRQSVASLACTCLTEAIVLSLQLKLLPPYIDLGFDQQAIANSRALSVRMGEMQTIGFIAQYGRPMYVDLACKPELLISLPGGERISICLE